ncbi:single-stranded DNA-binding protein [Thiomicrorhabdus sp. 6S2-11]|uniref:Single-stranded DNA-binding protein n=1 Tax=Thiomicrorhabdus marina TaxID=2818442 RepID=A0ABS3Q2X4_9GAMM|nr:single-stranded DNA-binding protein [Thiomicrorhabdus marina]MBO1926674.1 single-stranded DNA-binding protein [Thiomicrorhabdus marina]
MAFISANIRLAKEPQSRTTRNNNFMATGFGFAKLGEDSKDLALSLVAFGEVANELMTYSKGDGVNVAGTLKINSYTNQQNQEVEQMQITLEGIAGKNSTKQVRNENKQGYTPQTPPNMGNHSQNQNGGHTGHSMQSNQNGFHNPQHQAAYQNQQPPTVNGGYNDFEDDDVNF